jgi:CheY-like chemotaxis protein
MKAKSKIKNNSLQPQRVKILVADDDINKLPYLIASLIKCDDDTISIEERNKLINDCFELKSTTSYLEVENLINATKNPFIPDIALLDVNFEKNQQAAKGKSKKEDLRYKGIELAELIKKQSPNTKVILNTGYADHKEWKEKFKDNGFEVKADYAPTDSPNTIYRKEKSGGEANAMDAITHLIQPILNDFAVNIYKSLDASSKRRITLLLRTLNKNTFTAGKVNAEISKISITANPSNTNYLLKDICHFDAQIGRENSIVGITHYNLLDAVNSIVADASSIKDENYPIGNGPWAIPEIQTAFVEHFRTEKEEKVGDIRVNVKSLSLNFFTPLLTKVDFTEHGYKGEFSLDIYKKNVAKINDQPAKFSKALINNITLRIASVLVANICNDKKLSKNAANNRDTFGLHKKVFKKYIDINPKKISVPSSDCDPEHTQVKSLINTRLGLSYNEEEDSYKTSDLCKIELDIYNELYTTVTTELSL